MSFRHRPPLLAVLAALALVFTPMNAVSATTAQSRLLRAIDNRDVAEAHAALAAGADANLAGEFSRTPLHEAASESAEIAQLLLERGARPNVVDGDGRTPLHLAYADTARILLAHGADFLVLDKNGNTALHLAAEHDAAKCTLLLDAGIPVDARNNAGLSPLHFAALQAQETAADVLLKRGANINATTLAPYDYKWSYIAWDVKGMEERVTTGATPLSIALAAHERTKWSSGKYAAFATFLRTRGASEPQRANAKWFAIASPLAFVAFFWLLFHADAYLRKWSPLADRFTAASTPAHIKSNQNGAVGRVGTIQLRKMLRAAVTTDGLYLAMPSWVLAAHPPLNIPWSQLRVDACSRGVPGTRVELRVAEPNVPIFLVDGIAEDVLTRMNFSHNCKGAS